MRGRKCPPFGFPSGVFSLCTVKQQNSQLLCNGLAISIMRPTLRIDLFHRCFVILPIPASLSFRSLLYDLLAPSSCTQFL
ncbi:hypothetical protein FF2_037503 [Malus domestica]